MVKLGIANSRMKDFYDLWMLAQIFQFEGPTLAAAIHATFNHDVQPCRGRRRWLCDLTSLTLQRSKRNLANISHERVVSPKKSSRGEMSEVIREFVMPVAGAIFKGTPKSTRGNRADLGRREAIRA